MINTKEMLCSLRTSNNSSLAVGVVSGILVAVIGILVVLVLFRRQRIKRRRTLRRLLQEKEVGRHFVWAGDETLNQTNAELMCGCLCSWWSL